MRILSEPSVRGGDSADETAVPLSVRIRALTSSAHRGLETRTGWPDTLVEAGDVSTMLQMFRALHASLDAARARFEDPFRHHGFGLDAASALSTIDDDLRALRTRRAPRP